MKPSERIKEIAENFVKEHGICEQCNTVHHPPTYQTYFQEALLRFLDEEYEKQQRLTHFG